ncbi:MAG: SDR family NAD(P)-dependent oxidoreductase [Ectothiorhodospiraceae bacterium]|jgi:NAD(P)-dependent dehydrogenase (short-subunit alcohol dehydrogenase family)
MHQKREAVNEAPLVFLLGASTGIGRALAEELARRGRRVVIGGRRRQTLEAVVTDNPRLAEQLHPWEVDVTDAQGMREAYAGVEAQFGPVDTLIVNAGDYEPMPVEDFDPALFRRLCDVNYLGPVNAIASALPAMRGRRRGQIIITASVAGYRGLPRSAPYSASKAAAINLAEALRPELARDGIILRVINPGFVRTRLTDKNRFEMPLITTPEKAATFIADRLDGGGFEIVFPRRLGWALKLMRVLPYRLFFAITARMV